MAEGNPYQFLGFLAPVGLFLVGATPDYKTDKLQSILHPIGAYSGALFIGLYSIFIPHMFLTVGSFLIAGALLSLLKKDTLTFWLEMAMYISTYIILIKMI